MSVEGCGVLDDVIAELALGLLDGAERAAALAHIERCGDCQAEVASLTAVGEQLLLLAPEVPPPAGFESRVLGRIDPAPEGLSPLRSSGAGRSRRWRQVRVFGGVAAAVIMMIALVVVGRWTGSDDGGTVAVSSTEMLDRRERVVGEALLWHSSPPMLEVDVSGWLDGMLEHGARLNERWWLSVETDGGAKEMYAVSLSRSPSEATLDVDADRVAAVALVDDEGRTWCSGRFAT